MWGHGRHFEEKLQPIISVKTVEQTFIKVSVFTWDKLSMQAWLHTSRSWTHLALYTGTSRSPQIWAWWAGNPSPAAQQRKAGFRWQPSPPSTSGGKKLWPGWEPSLQRLKLQFASLAGGWGEAAVWSLGNQQREDKNTKLKLRLINRMSWVHSDFWLHLYLE